ncbi:SRPBCC family protein [Bacillus cihuensis]|uniref:SRPBCC family protein n=1 Tax=Bacillus cihuensis TaxID=1208599 RepID=UPI000417D7FC|nr:SRPBCC family protein [Bacillus cihuensis]
MSHTIHQEVKFSATCDRVFEALTNAQQFSQVTGGAPTEIDAQAGGPFSLFGGMIQGRNIELVPGKRIVQAWRAANWEKGKYSVVKFELIENGTESVIVLEHTGYPEGQGDHLSNGWKENYWQPLEKYFT